MSTTDRDEGMAAVLLNASDEWKHTVYRYIKTLPAGWTGTGEDIRLACPKARAPQAWGAAINTAVRRGWLVPTGNYTRMRSRTSHARETKVYLRTLEQSE